MNIEEEGGGIFDKLKGKAKGLKDKAKGKAQDAMLARAQAKALKSGMGALGNATKSDKRGLKSSATVPIGKLLTIILATGVLGAFVALTINKSQNMNDSILRMVVLMLVMIIPVIMAYMGKSGTLDILLDTIVQSQINIICIYTILAFTTWSALVKSPSFDNFKSMKWWEITIIVVGLFIPLAIILKTFIKKDPLGALTIAFFAVAAAAILLSPQWISS
jgi:hypothetical protein